MRRDRAGKQYIERTRERQALAYAIATINEHATATARAEAAEAKLAELRAQAETMAVALNKAIGRSEWVVDGYGPSFDDYVSLAQSVKSALAAYRQQRGEG
jgi:hypothetical protein